MTKPYIVFLCIAAAALLILKLTDLEGLDTQTILEIAFYIIIIIGSIYHFVKMDTSAKKLSK